MKNNSYIKNMSSSNMINPANYYNPFAKYNYVSKSRGVYIPKDTAPLLDMKYSDTKKSSNIYSENYDAETDVMQSLNNNESKKQSGVFYFINRFFS